jgi:AcrR family transcriptional regulator
MASGTRERLVNVAATLLQRQGLIGTGIKQILNEAGVPFSSLYHFFPGGKDELAAEAIRTSGEAYQRLVEGVLDGSDDPITAFKDCFAGAAETLRATGYADACPIATVALEVASTNEPLRVATAEVFDGWLNAAAIRFARAGLSRPIAESLALSVISLLEGAFVLCRAARSTQAMEAAGAAAAVLIEGALHALPSGQANERKTRKLNGGRGIPSPG